MKNRARNRQFKIWLDEKEWEVFHQKFKMSESKYMTEFIVRCVFAKEIFVLDMQPFRELQQLLSNEANNINQVAR